MKLKKIILCADDYGLNTSISQGIIDLVRRGHLSAVSCMTTAPFWSDAAPLLKPYQGQVDLGLHFNLTEGKPVSNLYIQKHGKRFFSLPELILRSFFGLLDLAAIEQECEAQLLHFHASMDSWPDFIDGHQHVHHLPGVRDAILRIYDKHLRQKAPYIRSVQNATQPLSWRDNLKQGIIKYCGAAGLERRLKKAGIPHNSVFSGIYSFSEAEHYAQIFPRFLQKMEDCGLIMCHPGLKGETENDPIAKARFAEYSYLAGEQFTSDCENFAVCLGKGEFVV